jgi:carboxymethylenebutenolidase
MRVSTQTMDVSLGRFHCPHAAAELPGLVLIHDVWGPSEHSRALAADLAGEGFGVLEIDLYRDRAGPPSEDPGAFIRSLPDPEILADLDRGAEWLLDQTTSRIQQVGVVGVCMGGTYALLAASESERFRAAAPFYGILSYKAGLLADPAGRDPEKKPGSPIERAPHLRMPILASFGAADEFVPAADVDVLEAGFAASGSEFRVDRYPGAGHAFLNRTREAAYHPTASAEAWARIVPFLHAQLD